MNSINTNSNELSFVNHGSSVNTCFCHSFLQCLSELGRHYLTTNMTFVWHQRQNKIRQLYPLLMLSQNMTNSSLISTFMPSNNCLNQTMLEKFTTVATYYASSMDWDVQFCFLLMQDTNLLPRKNAPPLFLFLTSRFLAQSVLVNTFSSKFHPSLYHNP